MRPSSDHNSQSVEETEETLFGGIKKRKQLDNIHTNTVVGRSVAHWEQNVSHDPTAMVKLS